MPEVPLRAVHSPDADVEVELEHTPEAAGRARRSTRTVLVSWRLPALSDAVCLAVTELVTNAVKYGHPPVGLRLRRNGQRVRIDVHDDNPTEPGLPPATVDDSATSGRGLAIVASLADQVGCEQIPDDGKIVYAEFSGHAADSGGGQQER